MKRKVRRSAFLIILAAAVAAGALLLFQPVRVSVKLSEQAPLGALAIVDSRAPTQVTVRIHGKHDDDIVVTFAPYATHHEVPILGLYPDTANRVDLVLTTNEGKTFERSLTVRTDPLPPNYPEMNVQRLLPDLIAPGMTFLHLGHYDESGSFTSLPTAIDAYGHVRWYYTGEIGHVLRQLDNGNLLIQGSRSAGKPDNLLVEIDMLGNTVAIRAEVATGIHHDVTFMPNGNMLVLSSAPGSFEDGVVEVDGRTGKVLRGWDFRAILDPNRPLQPRNLEEADWLHLNGIDFSAVDDSIIVSGRDQSAVVKVDVDTGALRWILGNHGHWEAPYRDHLLTAVGDGLNWQWGQHAPMVHPSNPDRILVYDNGNERSYTDPVPPAQNYSRAVEFEIDEAAMTVRQVWEYGRELGSQTFTPFIGDANYLSNGNRLVCFGGITKDAKGNPVELFDFAANALNEMKISARIVEVTAEQPAREVMRISISDPDPNSLEGFRSYRAERYPLYHPSNLD